MYKRINAVCVADSANVHICVHDMYQVRMNAVCTIDSVNALLCARINV